MLPPKLHAQKLEFDIIWLGKIGKLHIQRTADEDSTCTSINSVVKIPFYKLSWATTLSTIDGKLATSIYQQLLNNNKREFTEITMKADNLWQLTDNEGKKETITIRHLFYVSDLYFKEPVNEAYIFSERFGRSLPIINNGNGHYTLMLPDDNDCEYFYEEQKIDVQRDELYEGVDIVITTPKRLSKLYFLNGINLNKVELFFIDDAELLFKNANHAEITRLSESMKKCQYILLAKDLDKRFAQFEDTFMIAPQVVKENS